MTVREQRIKAGVEVIEAWVKADPRGYIKADDHEVVARIMDAADGVLREQIDALLERLDNIGPATGDLSYGFSAGAHDALREARALLGGEPNG
jgi:hypothetical protein